MWLFTKKARRPAADVASIDLDGTWSNLVGTVEGAPTTIRLNSGLAPVAGHADYGNLIIVRIGFNAGDDGMPCHEDDFRAVDQIEDLFHDALQAGYESLLALAITTARSRDLLFYTRDRDAAIAKFEAMKPGLDRGTHAVEFIVIEDPRWDNYRRFAA
jgi:hypothetical protein